MPKIQGFKLFSSISSIDFNKDCNLLVAGGKAAIKIVELNTDRDYWFNQCKSIMKYKGTGNLKTCVSELSWNKYGADYIAVGTTSGYVLVYSLENNMANALMQAKKHDGNIKNIVWIPKSCTNFLSSSYQNEIILWDIRSKNDYVSKYEYEESVKIRDIKFNPHDSNLLAMQCSTKTEILDFRKMEKPLISMTLSDNDVQGNRLQWDPNNKERLATSVSKYLTIYRINSEKLDQVDRIWHYSLIKSFSWLKNQGCINLFGISGEHPEKNICFYNLNNKDRIERVYAGNNRSVECWILNSEEDMIVSAYNAKQKRENSKYNTGTGCLIAQHILNFIDPNQVRYQRPVVFDNNHGIALSLQTHDPLFKDFPTNPNYKVTFPLFYEHYESQSAQIRSVKEEFQYLHYQYIIVGKNETIVNNNVRAALSLGKSICADLWRNLFKLAFPEQFQQHTIESIYEQRIPLQLTFNDNRIFLTNKELLRRNTKKYEVETMLQYMVDENELQTAAIATLCLIQKKPSIISNAFLEKVITSYIQILRGMQLYNIASETILETKLQDYTKPTTFQTKYRIKCGWCNIDIKTCTCNILCVICKDKMNGRMAMLCKSCGHGGHASEYWEWFKREGKNQCPHLDCKHYCFEDFCD